MNNKYAFHIFWSDDDEGFIAICDEFPGLSTFGETREEALKEAQVALSLMIEQFLDSGRQLPNPQPVLVTA